MRRPLQKKRQQRLLKYRTAPHQSTQTITGKRARPNTPADDGRRKPPALRTGATEPPPVAPPSTPLRALPPAPVVHTPRPPLARSPLGMRLTAGRMQRISEGTTRPYFMSRPSAGPDTPFQIRMKSPQEGEEGSTGLTPIVPKTIATPDEILGGIVYSMPDVPPLARATPTKPICVEPKPVPTQQPSISFLPINLIRTIRISALRPIRTRSIPKRLAANFVMGYPALFIARIAFSLPTPLPPRSFAWMHIQAHSLLGIETQNNFIIGTQGANYRHYVIENLIRLLVLHSGLSKINIQYRLIPFAERRDLKALHVFHYLQYELVLENQLSRKLETIVSIQIDLTDHQFPTTKDDDFCFALVYAQLAKLYRIDASIKNRVLKQIREVARSERVFIESLDPYQTPVQPVLERRSVTTQRITDTDRDKARRRLFSDIHD